MLVTIMKFLRSGVAMKNENVEIKTNEVNVFLKKYVWPDEDF